MPSKQKRGQGLLARPPRWNAFIDAGFPDDRQQDRGSRVRGETLQRGIAPREIRTRIEIDL